MKSKTNDKDLISNESAEEYYSKLHTGYDPQTILEAGRIEARKYKGKRGLSDEDSLFKAMSIFEFDNGLLLTTSVPEGFRTFSIEMSLNLQKEYDCITTSEKATAELMALNYIRILAVQQKIGNLFGEGRYSELSLKYLAILSKELDRANRHYLCMLQTLKMIKQPMLAVNIKTQTAVVGQNQVIQTKNE